MTCLSFVAATRPVDPHRLQPRMLQQQNFSCSHLSRSLSPPSRQSPHRLSASCKPFIDLRSSCFLARKITIRVVNAAAVILLSFEPEPEPHPTPRLAKFLPSIKPTSKLRTRNPLNSTSLSLSSSDRALKTKPHPKGRIRSFHTTASGASATGAPCLT